MYAIKNPANGTYKMSNGNWTRDKNKAEKMTLTQATITLASYTTVGLNYTLEKF